jgi:hypothetical protein
MSLSVGLSLRIENTDGTKSCSKCGGQVTTGFYLSTRADGRYATTGLLCPACATGKEHVALWDVPMGKDPVCAKRRRAAVTRQEHTRSTELGGRRQTGSGAVRSLKGDGRVAGKYRIEFKSTVAASFTVKLSDLTKIRSECTGLEAPLFEIEFWERYTLKPIEKWVLVPWDTWKDKAGC